VFFRLPEEVSRCHGVKEVVAAVVGARFWCGVGRRRGGSLRGRDGHGRHGGVAVQLRGHVAGRRALRGRRRRGGGRDHQRGELRERLNPNGACQVNTN